MNNLSSHHCHRHSHHSPLNRLQPVLELRIPIHRNLERRPGCQNNVRKVLVICGRQVVQLLVNALDVPGKIKISTNQFTTPFRFRPSILLTYSDTWSPTAPRRTSNAAESASDYSWPSSAPPRSPHRAARTD